MTTDMNESAIKKPGTQHVAGYQVSWGSGLIAGEGRERVGWLGGRAGGKAGRRVGFAPIAQRLFGRGFRVLAIELVSRVDRLRGDAAFDTHACAGRLRMGCQCRDGLAILFREDRISLEPQGCFGGQRGRGRPPLPRDYAFDDPQGGSPWRRGWSPTWSQK